MPEKKTNTSAEPMTYEVFRMARSLESQRASAAQKADDMSLEELKQAATDLQIDASGARSKAELTTAIKEAARPTTVTEA
jgi:hypothetical protein